MAYVAIWTFGIIFLVIGNSHHWLFIICRLAARKPLLLPAADIPTLGRIKLGYKNVICFLEGYLLFLNVLIITCTQTDETGYRETKTREFCTKAQFT